MDISLIAAAAENNIIGKDAGLPWHLPDDFRFFKDKTSGHHVIMGRKTWETFDKPLPKRPNIVVTRREDYRAVGATVVHSLEEALAIARKEGEKEAFVIGGEQLYRMALPLANRIYLTRVHATVEGDTYFPHFDEKVWKEVSKKFHKTDTNHSYPFTFLVYERIEH